MGLVVTKPEKILVQRLVANVPNDLRLKISLAGKWERHNLWRMGDLDHAAAIVLVEFFETLIMRSDEDIAVSLKRVLVL